MGNHSTIFLLCLLSHLQHFDAVKVITGAFWELGGGAANTLEILPSEGDKQGEIACTRQGCPPL